MNFKFTFLVLSVVLAIECFYATPLQQENSSAQQEKLIKFMVDEMNKLVKLRMSDCKRIAEEVLNDQTLLDQKTELMENYLNDFRNFIKHVNEFGDEEFISEQVSTKPGELLAEQVKVFDRFKEPETEDAKLIKASLVKHGIADQWKVLEPTVQAYCDEFIKRGEDYLQTLKESGKADENKLIDAINEMKNESVTQKRFDALNEYFSRIPTDD